MFCNTFMSRLSFTNAKNVLECGSTKTLVEDEAAGQWIASSDSVCSGLHTADVKVQVELWSSQHSYTLLKGMYLNMTSIFQIPARAWLSWEEVGNKQEKQKVLLTQFMEKLRCAWETLEAAKPKKSLGSWETKRILTSCAKAKLNLQQNKLGNFADTICGEANTTYFGDIGSCKSKRSLRSWETKRILVANTKLNFQWNWFTIQTTLIEQRLKRTWVGEPRADSGNQRRRPTRPSVPTRRNALAWKNTCSTQLWVNRCRCLFRFCDLCVLESKQTNFGCSDRKIVERW